MTLQSRRNRYPVDLRIITPFPSTTPRAQAPALQQPHHPTSLPPPNTYSILDPAPPSRPVQPIPYNSIISTTPTGYDAIDRAQFTAVHTDQWIHDRCARQRWLKEMVRWKGEMEEWDRLWRVAGKRDGWVIAVVNADGVIVGGVDGWNGVEQKGGRGVGDGRKEAWVLLSEYEREPNMDEEKQWWYGIGRIGWRWWKRG